MKGTGRARTWRLMTGGKRLSEDPVRFEIQRNVCLQKGTQELKL